MANSADIKYIPRQNGSDYEAISASSVIASVLEMLTSQDDIGSIDIFGDVLTVKLAAEMQSLRRSRAAEILRRVANELDAADKAESK